MQAYAKHQQDDADFREFIGDILVRHIAGRKWAHEDAGEQIADQWRHANALCDQAEDECQYEADDDGGNQRGVMLHAAFCRMGAWDATLNEGYSWSQARAVTSSRDGVV